MVRDDGLHQAPVLLQANQAAAQQPLDLVQLCLPFTVAQGKLEIGRQGAIIATNWTGRGGVARRRR